MVPGANLLSIALGVIGAQTVGWRQYLGHITNAAGLKVDTWAASVPLAGSLQPVDSELVQRLGLDWAKNYVTFYTTAPMGAVERDRTGDRLTWQGRTYQILDKADWFPQDGWNRVLCVEVSATT